MKIEVLGTGCTTCKKLVDHVKEAVADLSGAPVVEKVEDMAQIVAYGVMTTPALVVDGQLKSTGKLLSVEEVRQLLSAD